MTATAGRQEAARPPSVSPAARPTVLAVVVTHRGRRWLKDCLVSLNTQTYRALQVLVVDDASPDSRAQPQIRRIAKRHLRRRRWGFIRTPRPLGFGGAINWALSKVRADAELLLFIHDDAALDQDSLELMVERMLADDKTAVVGPKVVLWNDPSRLEEVGMAADRFGYPYKGLEDGEIDLGQHDVPSEVFFVTSTCMLIRHDVFRQLQGWDSGMQAFAEDLDLCWRARVMGRGVKVEPRARARHAIALATGQRRSPFSPPRYYIRRNRLRAVAKNASTPRLVALVPQYVLLTFAEMIAFILLRQPREIVNLARALGWNILRLPQTLAQRARVQAQRRVPDRTLGPLMVREHTRLQLYLSRQLSRIEEAWGRRAEYLTLQSQEARGALARLRGWPAALGIGTLLALLLGFRNLLFAPPVTVAELLPYPGPATGMWRAFLSSWRDAGLGEPGLAPPGFALLGLFPLLTLGALGAAQKLLVVALTLAAGVSAYKLVQDVAERAGKLVAASIYALGSVAYAGLRGGRLGAMVFAAAAPAVLLFLLRLTGWTRPAGWRRGRAVARVALGAAVSAAFVPGSLVLYALAAAVLAAARAWLDRGGRALQGFTSSITGLVAAWVLLLPWSAAWWGAGGPFDLLWGASSDRYQSAFAGEGMARVVLGQISGGFSLLGLAFPLLGALALVTAEGQRRRVALALWSVVVVSGLLVSATAAGILPPVVAAPVEASVLPAAAFAGLAGIAVGAFRLDLPRRGLTLVHGLTAAALALAGALAALSLAPAVVAGRWRPEGAVQVTHPEVGGPLGSLFELEARRTGAFRVLWAGSEPSSPPSVARPADAHFLTGPRGRLLSDLFETTTQASDGALASVVASIQDGSIDRGGRLLGAFNIRYVVLERSPRAFRWLSQRDLAVVRTEPHYFLLKTQNELPRAALYDRIPTQVRAIEEADAALARQERAPPSVVAQRQGAARYTAGVARGPGAVFVAEARDSQWKASIGELELDRAASGWGNAYHVAASARGPLVVVRRRPVLQTVVLVVVALAWMVVAGAAFSARPASHLPARAVGRAGTGP